MFTLFMLTIKFNKDVLRMSENKTFGVKVPEELHNEARKLQDDFKTGEEFLTALIQNYKADKVKEQLPMVATGIKDLQTYTKKIVDVYLNLCYSIENETTNLSEKFNERLASKDSTILKLQEEINQQNESYDSLQSAFNNVCKEKTDLFKEVNQLTETISHNKELIDNLKESIEQYKEKNDTLNGLVTEYKQFKDDIEDYKIKLHEATDQNRADSYTIESLNNQVKNLNAKVTQVEDAAEDEIKELEKEHEEEIIKIKEQEQFKQEKALLAKDKEHQKIINKINEDSNSDMKDLIKENKEMTNRISKLLEEVNKLKSDNKDKDTKINSLTGQLKELSDQSQNEE
jgi:chromosome segregation ATPase